MRLRPCVRTTLKRLFADTTQAARYGPARSMGYPARMSQLASGADVNGQRRVQPARGE